MTVEKGNGFDPIGFKALGQAGEKIVDFGIEGTKAFLEATSKPLLEEFGLLVRDKVTYWKLNNIIRMLEKAKGKLRYDNEKEKLVIDPRVALQITENASQVSNDSLLDMWAGLFAASCNRYEEDENIFFIDILKSLTSSQVKLLSFLCENTYKTINISDIDGSRSDGVVTAEEKKISYDEVCDIMGSTSRLKIDTELDTLENMGLIMKPRLNQMNVPIAQLLKMNPFGNSSIRISLKTLRLYVKCQGSSKTPFEYFIDDVNKYYHNIIKEYIDVNPSDTIEHIAKINQEGIKYKDDIEYGNELLIKTNDWIGLPIEILNKRFRAWLVYRFVTGISKDYTVVANGDYWKFNYKDGLIKPVNNNQY